MVGTHVEKFEWSELYIPGIGLVVEGSLNLEQSCLSVAQVSYECHNGDLLFQY